MKKVILLILIAAVVFSCKKNETPVAADQYAEVSFNVTTLVPDAGRDWTFDVPFCDPDAIPGRALMKITDAAGNELEGDGEQGPNGSNYFKALVFYTNGELYTQTIKLPVTMCDNAPDCCDTYFVTEFYMYDENGNMIKAAPYPGTGNDDESEFFQFVTQPLPVELTICAFEKEEYYIDVLCFTPDYYQLFGFFWFEITEITVREVCFFGDICIDWFDYNIEGDKLAWWEQNAILYPDQMPNGVAVDMPAIFEVTLKKWFDFNEDGEVDHPEELVVVGAWSNDFYEDQSPWLGQGEPLCFRYADYDATEDLFFVTLFIWAPYGDDGVFSFGPLGDPHGNHIWQFTDNALEDLDLNGDGVIEFAWGDCVEDPEYPLPESAPGK
jgi:hypothetical protein